MADKELRKMNRTELIEIIYALQQNERSLREENEKLHCQLDDKFLRMENAGSIAEAAMSLNHVFEDAEAAARQYLDSLWNIDEEAAEILADAQRQADEMLIAAQTEADRAAERIRQMELEYDELRDKTVQDVK
ncbi:MAG: hypothetical protein LUF92_00535 [Clostridiales bacterium]|nr:hypothetical protein [Clostridiales bacterium]